MRYLFLLIIVLCSPIYFENDKSDWIYIFDGKSFDGWHQYNSDVIGNQWSIAVSYTHLTLPTKRIV